MTLLTNSCLPELKKIEAIKEELDTGWLSLQSYLFKSAIRLHIAFQSEKKKLESNWYQIYQKMLEKKPE
ncbi:MAG: hypothetical protein OXC37_03385 [Bdellovibrionaceae bacterium]|nr:hypothetical protein [Pseudobdellovibrionaceae bacterium]